MRWRSSQPSGRISYNPTSQDSQLPLLLSGYSLPHRMFIIPFALPPFGPASLPHLNISLSSRSRAPPPPPPRRASPTSSSSSSRRRSRSSRNSWGTTNSSARSSLRSSVDSGSVYSTTSTEFGPRVTKVVTFATTPTEIVENPREEKEKKRWSKRLSWPWKGLSGKTAL